MGTLVMTSMRRNFVAVATAAMLLAVTGSPAATALEELRSANLAEVRDGVRIRWLLGYPVTNDQNEKIGTIFEFVAGRDVGLFAVLQIGGFLAVDSYLVAVPFKTLVIDADDRRIRLPGATRGALRNFPPFHFPD
jgi:hypothetical protein